MQQRESYKDLYPYCVSVQSPNFKSLDDPWEWCHSNLGSNSNWCCSLDDHQEYLVHYYFESKEDAVRFQLTWG